jgi:hypothetical protein
MLSSISRQGDPQSCIKPLVGRKQLLIWVSLLTVFIFTRDAFSQIRIHESVNIVPPDSTLLKTDKLVPALPPPAGLVIPKGLRNRLQVYYTSLERLDEPIPSYAKLKIVKSDTLGRDSIFYDQPAEFRFPNVLYNPETFLDWCGNWGEEHTRLYYSPIAESERFDVTQVVARDTVSLHYITGIVGEGRRDTLALLRADTVKLHAESTIVGWNVSFGDYNTCLETWNEKMDAFVGLACPSYFRFPQGSPSPWADSLYDAYKRKRRNKTTRQIDTIQATIRSTGCALTSMAMVLKAYGLDADPGKLEDFMTARRYINSTTGAVTWAAIDVYPDNSVVQHDSLVGRGLDTARVSLPLSALDYSLQRCKPVIVQVANPPGSLNNHWVVVTDKIGNGQYQIVDPGPLNGQTLASYGNTIYKMSIYKPK